MVDPEKYPGTNTFVNLFGLKKPKYLDTTEQFFSARRAYYLQQHPDVIGVLGIDIEFDMAHLKAIHK